MIIYTRFSPSINRNFSFVPTLDGQQYNCVMTWSLAGQRWIVNLYSLSGQLVLSKPLRSSPQNYNINLVEGYFQTSQMVFREASNTFEVSP